MGTVPHRGDCVDDEEACWNSLKRKEAQEGNCCPIPDNGGKRAKSSSKKQRNAHLDCAEEFRQKMNISQEDYQKRVQERLCLRCGKKGHNIGDCKANTPSNLGKSRQKNCLSLILPIQMIKS